MSLDSNTTELNEILNMANNLPDTNGENSASAFTVTATLSLTSETEGTLTDISHSFTEIEEARNSGATVVLDIDISQMVPDQRLLIPLVSYVENALLFSVSTSDGSIILNMTCLLGQEDYSLVLLNQIATAEDLAGLGGGETVNNVFNVTVDYAPNMNSTGEITFDISNLSSTFAEIKSAYDTGKEISLVGHQTNSSSNDVILFNMSIISDYQAVFSATAFLGTNIVIITFNVTTDNSITVICKMIA